MKKLTPFLLALAAFAAIAATVKISVLPTTPQLNDADLVPIVQTGVTKQVTFALVASPGWTAKVDEDFLGDLSGSGKMGSYGWTRTPLGTGVIEPGNAEAGRPGLLVTRNVTVNDGGTVQLGQTTWCVSNGPIFFECSAKCRNTNGATASADGYRFKIGFGDVTTGLDTDGLAWCVNTNSGALQTVVSVNGVRTFKNSTSNVLADAWMYLAFRTDDAGTNCIGYVGSSVSNAVAAVTNDLWTLGLVVTNKFGPTITYEKVVGVLATTNIVDYVRYYQTITTPR